MARRLLYRYFVGVSLCLAVGTGCVERRMTVRSNPSNALVVLDGQEVGFTPQSINFTYYGERQIKLVKDGYETKTINQTVSTPWYQYFPLDFISEVMVPWRIRDERDYLYTLEPRMMVANDELLKRAEETRVMGRNPPAEVLRRAGVAAPDNSDLPAITPPPSSIPAGTAVPADSPAAVPRSVYPQ